MTPKYWWAASFNRKGNTITGVRNVFLYDRINDREQLMLPSVVHSLIQAITDR